jgi:hypothetical protein
LSAVTLNVVQNVLGRRSVAIARKRPTKAKVAVSRWTRVARPLERSFDISFNKEEGVRLWPRGDDS